MSAIRITGTLARDAQARYTPEGVAWLWVEIDNASAGINVEARRCMGQGPAAQMIAARTAKGLRRGSHVTIHADRYGLAPDACDIHLLLEGVTHIEHDAAVAYHERIGAQ